MSGKDDGPVEVTVYAQHNPWKGRFGFTFLTLMFVCGIGASKWLFGGSWVIDIMLGGLWLAALVMFGKMLPARERRIFASDMTVDEIEKAVASKEPSS